MQDLSSLNVGDFVAAPSRQRNWINYKNQPILSHDIFRITKLTKTQIEAFCHSETVRIRISDGMFIGDQNRRYVRAAPATPEILALHQEQRAAIRRFTAAAASLRTLMGKELHQLQLTTEQMEHLGKAWAEVQAMAHPTDQHHAG